MQEKYIRYRKKKKKSVEGDPSINLSSPREWMKNFTCPILFSWLLCEISVWRADKQPVYKFPTFIPFLLGQYALSPEKYKNRIHLPLKEEILHISSEILYSFSPHSSNRIYWNHYDKELDCLLLCLFYSTPKFLKPADRILG